MRPSTISHWILCLVVLFVTSCGTSPAVAERNVGVAVWDLVDNSALAEARPEFAELLSAEIIDTLKQKTEYTFVERERLLLALEELGLGTTLLVDSATRLRLGRLVGARLMVFGGYMIINNVMRLDLRLVDVESGATLKAASETAAATDITAMLAAARSAAEKLLLHSAGGSYKNKPN